MQHVVQALERVGRDGSVGVGRGVRGKLRLDGGDTVEERHSQRTLIDLHEVDEAERRRLRLPHHKLPHHRREA